MRALKPIEKAHVKWWPAGYDPPSEEHDIIDVEDLPKFMQFISVRKLHPDHPWVEVAIAA